MEHFLLRTKCCKCDERLDVGHKGKQWLWSDLIILILLDSQSPMLLFELLGRMKLLALLNESRQEGSVWAVIVAFQPFIHLAVPSRLLKYRRSLGICELWGEKKRKEERNVLGLEVHKRPIWHLAHGSLRDQLWSLIAHRKRAGALQPYTYLWQAVPFISVQRPAKWGEIQFA